MEQWPELTAFARCIELQSVSWNNEGRQLINSDTVQFTYKERKILKSLLVQAMPDDLRKSFWLIASGAKREMKNHPNYYYNLTRNYPTDIPSPYKNQIELDLLRTFPADNFFKEQTNLDMLRNILIAYSRRSVTIGYCQGFNFIVGKLLTVYGSEEETFWVFTQIIEHLLPIDYYCELAELLTDCTILTKMLEVYTGDVFYHLHSINAEIYLSNAMYRWFMSLFIQNISSSFWLTIWDLFVLEGNIVLFKSAIALIKIASNDLLKMETAAKVQDYFNDEVKNKTDTNLLLYYLLIKRFDFNMRVIKKNRDQLLPKVIEGIKANNAFAVHKIEKNCKCNIKWPLCTNDYHFRHDILRYFIYQPLETPRIVKNYFDYHTDREAMWEHYNRSDQFDDLGEDEKKERIFGTMLLERRKHLCEEQMKFGKKSNLIINEDDEYRNIFKMSFERSEMDNTLLVKEIFQSKKMCL